MSYCRKGFFSVNLAPVGSWRDLYRIITDWHNCKYNLQPSTPIEVTETLSCVPEHQDVVNLLKRKRNDAYRLLLFPLFTSKQDICTFMSQICFSYFPYTYHVYLQLTWPGRNTSLIFPLCYISYLNISLYNCLYFPAYTDCSVVNGTK